MYGIVTVRQFSNALGIVEVSIAILIGLRHWSAKASAIGSALAVLMFLTTLSDQTEKGTICWRFS
jgi:reactive chlorine resistance protein C